MVQHDSDSQNELRQRSNIIFKELYEQAVAEGAHVVGTGARWNSRGSAGGSLRPSLSLERE
jgi:hypothetical protein